MRADESRRKTVYVVEAQMAIRELIADFIGKLEGFEVVGKSGRRAEAEQEITRLSPDIAVIDWILLPDISPENLAEAIRRCSPSTRVIVFSDAIEAHYVSDAISAGVAGFVIKDSSLETLANALRAVGEGKQFFCSEMAGVLRELLQRSSSTSAQSSLLSHREREVLREIAQGRVSKEIAAAFDLSVFTVENIRRRIMKKTGLRSVAELTLHAVKLRLIGSCPSSALQFEQTKRDRV
jgi:DNA-binding NarL/FixJ family response regulator